MARARPAILVGLVLIALVAGALIVATRAATRERVAVAPSRSPSPVASPAFSFPSPTPTTAPTPSPSPATTLQLTGEIRGSPNGTVSKTCGTQSAGYYLQVLFGVGSTTYQLTATIAPYYGPGHYAAPPARISLKPLGVTPPVLYAGTKGTFTINPDGRSGSLYEILESQTGQIAVNGNWQCP